MDHLPSGRFGRQVMVDGIGHTGQQAIQRARVLVVGCGALGNVIASFLARAGVGDLTLVDPDRVQADNLHRQTLFDDEDALVGRSKAEKAASLLRGVHPGIQRIVARQDRVDETNAKSFIEGMDVVVDATDNFATRYQINDVCVGLGKPWIYGGVVGATGMSMVIRPKRSPCLRCVFPEPPAPGVARSPETDGVFGPVVGVIGSVQAAEALKLIVGADPSTGLLHVDLWSGSMSRLDVGGPRGDCEACGS